MTTDYKVRHLEAILEPEEFEIPIIAGLKMLTTYRTRHAIRYGSTLADDYILGVAWYKIAQAMRDMLNGELGRLNAGMCDHAIHAEMRLAGFTNDQIDQGL